MEASRLLRNFLYVSTEGIVEFAIGQQTDIGRDSGDMEFQFQAKVEFQPQLPSFWIHPLGDTKPVICIDGIALILIAELIVHVIKLAIHQGYPGSFSWNSVTRQPMPAMCAIATDQMSPASHPIGWCRSRGQAPAADAEVVVPHWDWLLELVENASPKYLPF